MKSYRTILTFLLIAVVLPIAVLFPQGCQKSLADVGHTTATFFSGALVDQAYKNIDLVYDASLQTLKELNINVISKEKDKLSAIIVAQDVMDKKIKIKLLAEENERTQISIHIGVFGDRDKSQLILDHIHNLLGKE